MDDRQFDAIARSFASRPSRRQLLKGLIGGAAGGMLPIVGGRVRGTAQGDCFGQGPCPEGTQCVEIAPGQGCCQGSGGNACAFCPPPFADCGGGCNVDTSSDPNNCGSCGNVCPSGQCSGGSCLPVGCQGGLADCSGACVDLASDPYNCGFCGGFCESGQCGGGSCVPVGCPAGLTDCGGYCVDLNGDASNCGFCGSVCESGLCVAGSCAPIACSPLGGSCTGYDDCCEGPDPVSGKSLICHLGMGACVEYCGEFGYFNCTGEPFRCSDVLTDPGNCGSCGNICASGQCLGGGCVAAGCPDGLADCFGACVDLNGDAFHCGGCGIVCESGRCLGGSCDSGGCPSGYANCGDGCVQITRNGQNCGFCGNACTRGRICVDGQCVLPDCPPGHTFCESATTFGCVNILVSRTSCGDCFVSCGDGRCVDGVCTGAPQPPGAGGCPAGQTLCGDLCCVAALCCDGACTDLGDDARNCGACGVVCPDSEPCREGSCQGGDGENPTPTPTPAGAVSLVAFSVDPSAMEKSCYDISLTVRNETPNEATVRLAVEETVTYWSQDGTGKPRMVRDPETAFAGGDRREWCDGEAAGSTGSDLAVLVTVPAGASESHRLQMSHDWDWVEPPDALEDIVDLLLAVIPGGLALEVAKGGYDIAQAVDLVYDGVDWSPQARYAYSLNANGTQIAAGLRTSGETRVAIPPWKIDALQASVMTTMAIPFICVGATLLMTPLVGAATCAVATATAIAEYRIAYDPDPDYTAAVEPTIPAPRSLADVPDGSERDCAEAAMRLIGLLDAAQQAAVKGVAARDAGDDSWYGRQQAAARTFTDQAAAEWGTLKACMVDTPPDGDVAAGLPAEAATLLAEAGVPTPAIAALERECQAAAPDLRAGIAEGHDVMGTALAAMTSGFDRLAAGIGVVFRADWAAGLDGWVGGAGWSVDGGILSSDGSGNPDDRFSAPFKSGGLAAFAVEAEIRIDGLPTDCTDGVGFGLVARPGGPTTSYEVLVDPCGGRLNLHGAAVPLAIDEAWHRYRVEVRDQRLSVLVDRALIAETTRDRRGSRGRVGLFSHGVPIDVRRFEVIALPL